MHARDRGIRQLIRVFDSLRAVARGTPALAAALCAAVAGCGGGDAPRQPAVGVTNGIEHLRLVLTMGGVRTVVESWEHRPGDGCWSSRVRRAPAEAGLSDVLSTVVRDADGTRRRITRMDGPPGEQPGAVCAGGGPTALGVLRQIVATAGLRPAGTARVLGRTVRVLTGPPDAVILGTADPSRSTAVADITVMPAGAVMRILWDPVTRMPVRITTPRAEIVVDEARDLRQAIPAMTQEYLLAEEVPATPSALLRVFQPADVRAAAAPRSSATRAGSAP